jgi:cell division protein FtsQ
MGQNSVQVDTAALEQALAGHPWVRQAVVSRHFPDGLEVTVSEQIPVAIVALGVLYLVNAEGHPFKKVEPGDPADLPLVTGVEREEFVHAPDQTAARVREALQISRAYAALSEVRPKQTHTAPVASRMPRAGPLKGLAEVRLGRTGVTLVTDSGQEIHMGEGHSEEKLARLTQVQSELSRRGLVAESIRLDNRARPGWVTVKPVPMQVRPNSRMDLREDSYGEAEVR